LFLRPIGIPAEESVVMSLRTTKPLTMKTTKAKTGFVR